jgi:hypothetical protein
MRHDRFEKFELPFFLIAMALLFSALICLLLAR